MDSGPGAGCRGGRRARRRGGGRRARPGATRGNSRGVAATPGADTQGAVVPLADAHGRLVVAVSPAGVEVGRGAWGREGGAR